MTDERIDIIERAWDHRDMLKETIVQDVIRSVVNNLDLGELRIAEKIDGQWHVNEWLKKAVILYFPINSMETVEAGPFEFHDKIPLKHNYAQQQVRVVLQHGDDHPVARREPVRQAGGREIDGRQLQ